MKLHLAVYASLQFDFSPLGPGLGKMPGWPRAALVCLKDRGLDLAVVLWVDVAAVLYCTVEHGS